jgi:hypothetical protein
MKRGPVLLECLLLAVLVFLLSPTDKARAQTWTTVNSNIGINGMFMLNGTNGWAVGYGGIRATTDGATWGLPVSPTNNTLFGVWAADSSHVWAVGAAGTIVFWNGTTWSTQTSNTAQQLNAVWGTDATHVWAVANSGAIQFWNGTAWSAQTSATTQNLNGVWGADTSHVWAVGAAGTIQFWNGSAWSAQTSGTTNALVSLYVADATHAWAVSNASNVIQVWNGAAWAAVTPLSSYSYGYDSVRGANASSVWLGGITINGVETVAVWNGSAWASQNSRLQGAAIGMSVVSASAVWAADSYGNIAHWNGTAWVSQNAGVTGSLQSISGSAANNILAPDLLGGVKAFNGSTWSATSASLGAAYGSFVLDATDAWVAGASTGPPGSIEYWNGTTWSYQSTGTTNMSWAAWGCDASDVWAVGANGNIVKWNGSAWSAETSGTTQLMLGVWGTDASHVWAVGSSGTILFWNGTAWSTQTSPTTQQLQAVWGTDTSHVWASGSGGTIVFWNGSSWSSQTSGTTNALSGLWAAASNSVYAVGANGTILHWNGSSWSAQTSGTNQALKGVWGEPGGFVWAVGTGGTILGASLAATNPQASLQQPAGTALVNITGHVSFSASSVGTAAGALTFTIANNGTAPMTVSSVSVAGGNASDFTVNTAGMSSSVAASGSTTFTVNCTPSVVGSESTTLSVVTSDVLHNPISVTLNGTGTVGSPVINSPTFTGVTASTATLGGDVTSNGGSAITARGVVLSTNNNPVLGGSGVTNLTASGTTGIFTVNAASLAQGTQYYFAAYATNSVGTTYTSPVSTFTTLAPAIAVAQAGPLSNGVGSVPLGTVTLGRSSAALTFTITDPGNADLSSLAITEDGANPADFTVSALSNTTVTAGTGSATFTVTFTPAASGTRGAAIHIASNISGANNPFTISLTGTGQTVFTAWAGANNVANDPTVVGTNGLTNLMNFAFGLNPNGAGSGVLVFNGTFGAGGTIGAYGQPITALEPIANGVDFRALYVRLDNYATAGVTYATQFSADLNTWSTSTATPVILADDGTYQIVSVPYPPFIGGQKARFFRVSLTLSGN